MKTIMKKGVGAFFAAAICAMAGFLFGCSNMLDGNGHNETKESRAAELETAPETIPDGYIRINYKGSGDWFLWAWKDFAKEELNKCTDFPNGIPFKYKNGEFIAVDVKLAENPAVLGMIVVDKDKNKGSGDADLFFYFPQKHNEIFITPEGKIYVSANLTEQAKGVSSASITGDRTITLQCDGVKLSEETVTLVDKNGNNVPISDYNNDKLTLASSIKESYASLAPLKLSVTDENGIRDTLTVNIDSALVEDWFGTGAVKSIEDSSVTPGVVISGGTATFTTWAPVASDVKLLLFSDADALKGEPAMTSSCDGPNANGFWIFKDVAFGSNKYYKYRITHGDVEKDVADIWAKASSYESTASQIAEITPVEYKNPWKGTDYTEAVIYEMHITDWSQAFRASVETDSPGTFQEITAALGTNGDGEFGRHLKDLGVTHVQILPMFEYAITTRKITEDTGEENNNAYNWGYNPYHYNVPESRYAKDMKDGMDAVKAMQDMISAFHDAGIAVIMDVVYNHTNGTGDGSLYDMTVPGYFYRDKDYTGCGNAVSTDHKMVRKYVIESLKHWMKDYGINGFRFDLMGVHEQEMMKGVYTELSKIDPKVMVYGEPWTGASDGSYPADGCKGAVDVTSAKGSNGVGAFDDDFRDAIKGAEYGGFHTGQVQGSYNDDGIVKGLLGESGKNNRNETNKPGLALHYVECHDNYTLFDKLAYSLLDDSSIIGQENFADKFPSKETIAEKIKDIKAQNKLAAAYVLLSQGTPFINGGQEFLRTKQGDPDSYAADEKGGKFWANIDEVNAIDLEMKKTYSDVYNTYRGLIALRKGNPSAFGSNANASAETLAEGVTKYITGDFTVFFNATDENYDLDDKVFLSGSGVSIAKQNYALTRGVSGKVVIIDNEEKTDKGYTIAESVTDVASVPAKSFVILKK